VRDEQEHRKQIRLESLLLEGLQSETSEMTEEDWTDIREKVRQRRQRRTTGAIDEQYECDRLRGA